MTQALIALGGNVGAVHQTFLRAVEELERGRVCVLAQSGLYGSSPWPESAPEQPPYTNAVVHVRTHLGAWALLRLLKRIERRLGRTKKRRPNAQRVLDLDLIALGVVRKHARKLTLPHPRWHERAFVIAPLRCVAPRWAHKLQQIAEARSCNFSPLNGTRGLLWWRLAWPLPAQAQK